MRAQIDGMLSYHLLLSLWTVLRGVLCRDMVNLHDWSSGEFARDFHAAPGRFWAKCMSAAGRARHLHVARAPPAAAASPLLLPAPAAGAAQPLHGAKSISFSGHHGAKDDMTPSASRVVEVQVHGGPHGEHSLSLVSHCALQHNTPRAFHNARASGLSRLPLRTGSSPSDLAERLHCAQWRTFAAAWDSLVSDLRAMDLLSDAETEHLTVHDAKPCVAWLAAWLAAGPPASLAPPPVPAGGSGAATPSPSPTVRREAVEKLVGCPERPGGVLGAVLLPGLVHVGVLQQLVDGGGRGASSMQVLATLKQLRGVGLALLAGCGVVTAEEAAALSTLGTGWRAVPKLAAHQEGRQVRSLAHSLARCCRRRASRSRIIANLSRLAMRSLFAAAAQVLLAAAQQLAELVLSACKAESPSALQSLAPRFSTGLKNVLKGLEVEVRAARRQWFSPPALDLHLRVLAAVQQRAAAMSAAQAADCLARLAPAALAPAPATPTRALLAQPSRGPIRQVQSAQDLQAVAAAAAAQAPREGAAGPHAALLLAQNLAVLLSSGASDAQPRCTEARRALTTFLNSLAMDRCARPPLVRHASHHHAPDATTSLTHLLRVFQPSLARCAACRPRPRCCRARRSPRSPRSTTRMWCTRWRPASWPPPFSTTSSSSRQASPPPRRPCRSRPRTTRRQSRCSPASAAPATAPLSSSRRCSTAARGRTAARLAAAPPR